MISGQESQRRFFDNLRYVTLAVAIVLAVVIPTLSATTTLIIMAPIVAVYLVSRLLRR